MKNVSSSEKKLFGIRVSPAAHGDISGHHV